MMKLITLLLATCVVASTATVVAAQPSNPTLIQCKGKAVSPLPGSGRGNGEVSLSATFNNDRTLEVVLIDNSTNQLEPPFAAGVEVHTGSLNVDRAGSKETLKMIWQRASTSTDFVGFTITRGYTTVLQVGSLDSENVSKGVFSFFDGFDAVLYRGSCRAD